MLKKYLAALMLLTSTSHAAETVNILNWTDYIAPDTLAKFQAETGYKTAYDTFDSNEALNAKLVAGHSGYDLVFPSIHFMGRQIEKGLLKPLDKSQLPNWKNLNPVLLKMLEASDPGNSHGFPYLWGSTGIGYNVAKVKDVLGKDAPVDSWDLVLKPENMKKLAQCGVAFLDSAPALFPITLNYLGLPPHSEVPDDYRKATSLLDSVRPYIRNFSAADYIDDLAAGKICVAVGYSGDISQAQELARKVGNSAMINYVVPKEGAPMWFDMIAIPVDAPDVKGAYAFMNYLLRPEVIANITNTVHYANGNEKADALINPGIWSDTNIYPDADMLSRLFVMAPVSVDIETLRLRVWNEVMTGK
ncbi:polyamine ABC transporter substrate-binding protein [Pseudomonas cannabina]|uniref:Putrescine-binding periplasmic protein n=3 Tax=Pseudomonas syringae group TaxID=136849 RepID=A0A3M3Q709_PSECA|nr:MULTISPECIES: polyamine ABC transporter substrate-binding protein [Pseudomonas syringae group]KPB77453.1 Putrescine-binding periplasmic protein [Pseudomonas syringae pv. maculicola]KPW25682.1 Putrescine-binding periplasmic protein [Pseudomonas cannabina pv. alisalensis]MBM0140084.1 polyamine ABC transporter substrate-binding protein [Pseudomonas cannabina pv. alisalensis]QHE97207.1 extracellular solute-binding protein [Pseudomonas syringae pv. maculicola str. ES4326]QQN19714.1 polyamine ABC